MLSIDAWNDGESWAWNDWFNFDTYKEEEHGTLNETNALVYYQGLLSDPTKITDYEIDDDQYNLVLIRRVDRMPILAIEYGNKL